MTLRVAITAALRAAILLTLITQHAEGFQREHVTDDSFGDKVDATTRVTRGKSGSGN